MALPSSRFLRMAQRLKYRDGAVRHALLAVQGEVSTAAPQPPAAADVVEDFERDNSADIAALAAASQTPGFPGIGYAS